MLRTLFDGLQKSMGSSLDDFASFMWTFGLMLVALQVFVPFARIVIELAFTRAGISRAWVAACSTCGTRSVLGGDCSKCGAALRVPPMVRLLARRRRPSPALQRAGWAWTSIGALVFLFLSMRLLAAIAPSGKLEQLFAGTVLFAWAGIGYFLGGALGPRGGGPVGRVRQVFFAAAAAGLFGCALFLEQTVHPVPERVLGHVVAGTDSVELDGAKLAISSPELGLEVQVIDHPGLGLGRVLPLAWIGSTRSPIELGTTDAWLRDSSWKNAQTLMAAGAQVKRRTETFPLSPGSRYDVVLREREVLLRPAK